jgi:double-stranded uracil-DNA glycosylase
VTGARRPTPAELDAARDRTIPDVAAPGLRVLFAGINPGLYSAATGYHFARPGNRFWPALHAAGFTDRALRPGEQQQLLPLGLGITNVVARATARADELTPAEIRAGARVLTAKVERLAPQWLAIVGITVYRTAFDRPGATTGRQEQTIGSAGLWVLPNPSGLNASYQIDRLAEEFGRLRAAVTDSASEEQR